METGAYYIQCIYILAQHLWLNKMWWSFSRNFLAREVNVVDDGAEGLATSDNLHTAKCIFGAVLEETKILLSKKPSWRQCEKIITCTTSPWNLKSQLWAVQIWDFDSCPPLYKNWKSLTYSRNTFHLSNGSFLNGFKHGPVLWLGPITQPIWKTPPCPLPTSPPILSSTMANGWWPTEMKMLDKGEYRVTLP